MKETYKITVIYLVIFLFLTSGSYFMQRWSGAIFEYEYYRTTDWSDTLQSVSDNIPLEYEKGAGAYDDMVSGAIANGSNPANIIDKFTFSNYRVDSTDSNLKNLGSIFLLILLVIYSFPIILVKKNPTYKTMLFGVFGAILMGWANWLFLSMNWFISIDETPEELPVFLH